MKQVFIYILLLGLFSVPLAHAQQEKSTLSPIHFPDSIRINLEKVHKIEAGVIAQSFFSTWWKLELEQQKIIKRQTAKMHEKGYKLYPNLLHYFAAISNAYNIEHANAAKITNFIGRILDTCFPYFFTHVLVPITVVKRTRYCPIDLPLHRRFLDRFLSEASSDQDLAASNATAATGYPTICVREFLFLHCL